VGTYIEVGDAKPEQATQWFDQFNEWAGEQWNWPENGQWCPRHWAPCPVMGYNGVGASVEIMEAFDTASTATTKHELLIEMRELNANGVAICCHLGDETMLIVWERWPAEAKLPGQVER
jgi:hypothetical protein